MRFVTLHGKKSGRPIYVAADRVEAIAVTDEGSTEVCASCSVGLVAETPEEALRIVEGGKPDACAALVEAARKAAKGMFRARTECEWHEASQALLAALAAMEVPHE